MARPPTRALLRKRSFRFPSLLPPYAPYQLAIQENLSAGQPYTIHGSGVMALTGPGFLAGDQGGGRRREGGLVRVGLSIHGLVEKTGKVPLPPHHFLNDEFIHLNTQNNIRSKEIPFILIHTLRAGGKRTCES